MPAFLPARSPSIKVPGQSLLLVLYVLLEAFVAHSTISLRRDRLVIALIVPPFQNTPACTTVAANIAYAVVLGAPEDVGSVFVLEEQSTPHSFTITVTDYHTEASIVELDTHYLRFTFIDFSWHIVCRQISLRDSFALIIRIDINYLSFTLVILSPRNSVCLEGSSADARSAFVVVTGSRFRHVCVDDAFILIIHSFRRSIHSLHIDATFAVLSASLGCGTRSAAAAGTRCACVRACAVSAHTRRAGSRPFASVCLFAHSAAHRECLQQKCCQSQGALARSLASAIIGWTHTRPCTHTRRAGALLAAGRARPLHGRHHRRHHHLYRPRRRRLRAGAGAGAQACT